MGEVTEPEQPTCGVCGTAHESEEQAQACAQSHTGPLTAEDAHALTAKRIY